MVTTTTVYSFQKPDVSGDEDAWGGYLNANIDKYESILTGNTTITSVVITTADINGGTLDNVVIGGSTPAAITGTTITGTSFVSSGNITLGDNNKAIFGASTNLEIYASGGYSYIDEVGANNLNIRTNGANIGIYDTANSQYMAKFTTGGDAELYHNGSEKLATTSTGVDVTGTVTATGGAFTGNITLGDSNKVIFGAGSDLEIFHWSNNASYIQEKNPTGSLFIEGADVYIRSYSEGDNMIVAQRNDAVTLYYDNAAKLATTSTGVDISGDLNAVDNIVLATAMYHEGDTDTFLSFGSGGDAINLVTGGAARLSATNTGIDVTGNVTADGLTVDKTDTGTYSSTAVDNTLLITRKNSSGTNNQVVGMQFNVTQASGVTTGVAGISAVQPTNVSSADLVFQTRNAGTIGERLRITSDGSVGIATSSPNSFSIGNLVVGSGSGTEGITIYSGNDSEGIIRFADGTTGAEQYQGQIKYHHDGNYLRFYTAATEKLRITSDGSVGIGDSAPVSTLEISKSDQTNGTTLTITNAFSGGSWAVDDVIGSIDFRSDDASSSELTRGRIQSVTDNVTGTNWSYGTALTFSTAFNNTLSERLRINSNGDVGIGTTAPSSSSTYRYLDIVGGATNTGGVLQLRTSDFSANFQAYTSSVGGILGTTTNHGLIFITNNSTRAVIDASGNLLVGGTTSPSGSGQIVATGGVYLGGTGAANKLDDYEEGTFTANYSATGLTVTHDITTGKYTKVGNLVTFYILVGTDAVSGVGAVQLQITGLPFAPASGVLPSGSAGLAYSFAANENNLKWTLTSGGNLSLWDGDSNTAGVFSSNKLATGTNKNRLNIIGHYYTA
jgi:hypothetical protein